jgi:hypothetical protein
MPVVRVKRVGYNEAVNQATEVLEGPIGTMMKRSPRARYFIGSLFGAREKRKHKSPVKSNCSVL